METLDDTGAKYTIEGEVLKIFLDAMIVKEDKVNSLYYQLKETMIGSVIISSSESESNKTQLWPLCLGHMSETSMMTSSKRGAKESEDRKAGSMCITSLGNSTRLDSMQVCILSSSQLSTSI